MAKAQVHRFHDKVAIYIGNGQTCYLTEKEARKISAFLLEAAKDIKRFKFVDGKFKTQTVDLHGPLNPHGPEVAAVGKRRAGECA